MACLVVVFVAFEVLWLFSCYGFAVECGFGCYGDMVRFGGLVIAWCGCRVILFCGMIVWLFAIGDCVGCCMFALWV